MRERAASGREDSGSRIMELETILDTGGLLRAVSFSTNERRAAFYRWYGLMETEIYHFYGHTSTSVDGAPWWWPPTWDSVFVVSVEI